VKRGPTTFESSRGPNRREREHAPYEEVPDRGGEARMSLPYLSGVRSLAYNGKWSLGQGKKASEGGNHVGHLRGSFTIFLMVIVTFTRPHALS